MVNELFSFLFSSEFYFELKTIISNAIHLPTFFIFSLPEGLWVLAVTLTSKGLFITHRNRAFHLSFLPLIFAISLEIFQLIGLTNGTFDWFDILSAFCFWCIGYFLNFSPSKKQKLFQTLDSSSILCVSTYLIVFLAHVSN
ncbi:MAG: hypothetical protein JKY48_11745 [Flavobacteriales bacterium]|nr:hypothetical protein [Flavobacteriales bacterium]